MEMIRSDVVRGWRDPAYRSTLPLDLLAKLPDHPAGDHGSDFDWEIDQTGISAGNICMITFTAGCGTPGCSVLSCPSEDCPKPATCNKACTDAEVCTSSNLV
jgi:mersacidin/lichenicidin family type 2 lantibiotic